MVLSQTFTSSFQRNTTSKPAQWGRGMYLSLEIVNGSTLLGIISSYVSIKMVSRIATTKVLLVLLPVLSGLFSINSNNYVTLAITASSQFVSSAIGNLVRMHIAISTSYELHGPVQGVVVAIGQLGFTMGITLLYFVYPYSAGITLGVITGIHIIAAVLTVILM